MTPSSVIVDSDDHAPLFVIGPFDIQESKYLARILLKKILLAFASGLLFSVVRYIYL